MGGSLLASFLIARDGGDIEITAEEHLASCWMGEVVRSRPPSSQHDWSPLLSSPGSWLLVPATIHHEAAASSHQSVSEEQEQPPASGERGGGRPHGGGYHRRQFLMILPRTDYMTPFAICRTSECRGGSGGG